MALHVAFLWHQHQPCYLDPTTGHFSLPWVRMHAIKDYIGMANLLAEFPEVHQVINYVPSLLEQMEQYLAGKSDNALILSRVPANSLSAAQAAEILDTFFMANWEQMVNRYPRYRQLLQKRDFSRKTASEALKKFSADELRDLQVWFNLSWFHPTVIEKDERLAGLIKKDHGFTEEEKNFMLGRQLEIIAEVVPLHRKLAERHQLELTTTPFFHPILPLLCDATKARVATPSLPIPSPMMKVPEDAAAQLKMAIEYHQKAFGMKPRGMWPSEGSVSDDAAALIKQAGIDWFATDEEILACTLGTRFTRDGHGNIEQPEKLYRPWRLSTPNGDIVAVFRDHAISDWIGFRYYFMRPQEAANDLMAKLEYIRRTSPPESLVTIALDGENCWEHYENQGVEFLRSLYRQLSSSQNIKTTRICDHIDALPPRDHIGRIFPGSWIGHNYATWMGHWEKNRGWEYLTKARALFEERAKLLTPDKREAAQHEIYVAEGSDWFWWYGDDHTSSNDAEFDSLFRKHVRMIYEYCGIAPPHELLQPIMNSKMRECWRPPHGYINATVDGRRTSFFEWLGAGSYDQSLDSGSMQRSEPVPVGAMYYGLNQTSLFLRLDGIDPQWKPGENTGIEFWFDDADAAAFAVQFKDSHTAPSADWVIAVADKLVEIGVPLLKIGLKQGDYSKFYLKISKAGTPVQRIPEAGTIGLHIPEDPETAYSTATGLV